MARQPYVVGMVEETLPNLCYRVKLEDGREVICYTAGRVKMKKIKILVGDTVEVVLDPYKGKASNRIVWRR